MAAIDDLLALATPAGAQNAYDASPITGAIYPRAPLDPLWPPVY